MYFSYLLFLSIVISFCKIPSSVAVIKVPLIWNLEWHLFRREIQTYSTNIAINLKYNEGVILNSWIKICTKFTIVKSW